MIDQLSRRYYAGHDRPTTTAEEFWKRFSYSMEWETARKFMRIKKEENCKELVTCFSNETMQVDYLRH